jgi:hypothetical protein
VEIKWAETKGPVQPKRIATWIDALVPTLFAAIGALSVFSKDGSSNNDPCASARIRGRYSRVLVCARGGTKVLRKAMM